MCPFPRFSTLIAANRQLSKPIRLGDFITWLSKRPSMEPGNKIEVPHRRDRRKKSPGVSASISGDQIRRDWWIKSPGVSPALLNTDLRGYRRLIIIINWKERQKMFTLILVFLNMPVYNLSTIKSAIPQRQTNEWCRITCRPGSANYLKYKILTADWSQRRRWRAW